MKYRNGATIIQLSQPNAILFTEEKVVNKVAIMRFLADWISIPVHFVLSLWNRGKESPRTQPIYYNRLHRTRNENVRCSQHTEVSKGGTRDFRPSYRRRKAWNSAWAVGGNSTSAVYTVFASHRISQPNQWLHLGSSMLEFVNEHEWICPTRRLTSVETARPISYIQFIFIICRSACGPQHWAFGLPKERRRRVTIGEKSWRGSFFASSLRKRDSQIHHWRKDLSKFGMMTYGRLLHALIMICKLSA